MQSERWLPREALGHGEGERERERERLRERSARARAASGVGIYICARRVGIGAHRSLGIWKSSFEREERWCVARALHARRGRYVVFRRAAREMHRIGRVVGYKIWAFLLGCNKVREVGGCCVVDEVTWRDFGVVGAWFRMKFVDKMSGWGLDVLVW